MPHFHVVVIGAGIGGLTAALALARRGHHVDVLEKSTSIDEVGAGIQISPNASRVLFHLDLQKTLESVCSLPQATEIRDFRTGRLIANRMLGARLQHETGFPYLHVHRADLLQVLLDKVTELPAVRLHLATPVDSVQAGNGTVYATAGATRFEADLIVGADGIHSVVRDCLHGSQPARFTGNVAWRALIRADQLNPAAVQPVTTAWLGPGAHFVHYFVRAGNLINCVCVVEKSGWERESWTEPGQHAELVADFAGWHPTVRSLIAAMDPQSCFKWALFDRPPMARWSAGPVTLLGDACHPMLPFMAQGAAMAIEDAAVLANTLSTQPTIADALRRYESLRIPRTRRVQSGSRRNAQLFHASGIRAFLRNRVMARGSAAVTRRLFNYDAVNTQ